MLCDFLIPAQTGEENAATDKGNGRKSSSSSLIRTEECIEVQQQFTEGADESTDEKRHRDGVITFGFGCSLVLHLLIEFSGYFHRNSPLFPV